ncbi:MAG: hypothetical protein PHU85_20715 [Phycisphaerae bacterium]|nr:hypothetical protein [Phycisphaerae bacterium]
MADSKLTTTRPPYVAGMLAWLIPGAGHWYLGMKARGVILLVTVTALFWTGVAVGGVRSTVDPDRNMHWFMGEVCTGGNTLVALGLNKMMNWPPTGNEKRSFLKSRDIGVVYAGVAGLLNLLAIFDAIVRSVSGDTREEEDEEGDEEATA